MMDSIPQLLTRQQPLACRTAFHGQPGTAVRLAYGLCWFVSDTDTVQQLHETDARHLDLFTDAVDPAPLLARIAEVAQAQSAIEWH